AKAGNYSIKSLTVALSRFAKCLGKKPLDRHIPAKKLYLPNRVFSFQNSRLHDVNHRKLKIVALTCDPYPAIAHQYK
ncbi:hypothetical protein, partial [Pseudomonas sp. K2]|uniref:hypothetical protein n=1 Tax=Pseudomonas sp. K2 TaxID=212119 RepID=UPI001D02F1BD